MANFGELVLVLGDLHIPQRAHKIPPAFKRMLVPNKMQHVICTGNISREHYEELRELAPNVHMVAGDYDPVLGHPGSVSGGLVFPETKVLQVGAFRIGVIHGHQILPWKSPEAVARWRRKLNVDVLIAGHTHQNEVVTLQEGSHYYINPGSITGAISPLTDPVTPSFILLAVQDTKMVCYVYELVDGEVEVSKTELMIKRDNNVSTAANSILLESLLK